MNRVAVLATTTVLVATGGTTAFAYAAGSATNDGSDDVRTPSSTPSAGESLATPGIDDHRSRRAGARHDHSHHARRAHHARHHHEFELGGHHGNHLEPGDDHGGLRDDDRDDDRGGDDGGRHRGHGGDDDHGDDHGGHESDD